MRVIETIVVPLAEIVVGDYEVRAAETDPEIQALADSIRREGLLVAMGCVRRDGQLRLVHGHRRYTACVLARVTPVRVDVLEGDDAAMERASIIENYHRKDVSPIERAAQICAVLEGGTMTVEELAAVFDRSVDWVRDQAAMMAWPDDVRDAVHSRVLSAGAGNQLARIVDGAYRGFLIAQAVESGCTERTAQGWLAGWRAMLPAEQVVQQVPAPAEPGHAPVVPQAMCAGCRGMVRPDGLVPVFVCPACAVRLRQGGLSAGGGG